MPVVARAATVYLLVPWSVAVDPEATEAAEIMGRYCRGDAAAFQRLYALLAPRLLAYLFGLLRDKAAAEDILQVTFLKVHEARSTYVMGANPIPWMYTIAHRTCLDELRKRKRNRVQLTKDGTLLAEPAADLTGVPVEAGQDEAARPDPAAAAGALAALAPAPREPARGAAADQGPRPLHRRGGDDRRHHARRDQAARAPRLRDAARAARQTGRRRGSRSSPKRSRRDDKDFDDRALPPGRDRRAARRRAIC